MVGEAAWLVCLQILAAVAGRWPPAWGGSTRTKCVPMCAIPCLTEADVSTSCRVVPGAEGQRRRRGDALRAPSFPAPYVHHPAQVRPPSLLSPLLFIHLHKPIVQQHCMLLIPRNDDSDTALPGQQPVCMHTFSCLRRDILTT